MAEATLHLVVRTPAAIVVDRAIRGVTAEDATGRFGHRPGGEPLVAALVPSLLTFRDEHGVEGFVAVGRGTLRADRDAVRVAVRNAVVCRSLEAVREEVVRASRRQRAGERAMHDTFRALQRHLTQALVEEERER
jgi:F-type H+-transporting ATPase subunit epsilon